MLFRCSAILGADRDCAQLDSALSVSVPSLTQHNLIQPLVTYEYAYSILFCVLNCVLGINFISAVRESHQCSALISARLGLNIHIYKQKQLKLDNPVSWCLAKVKV